MWACMYTYVIISRIILHPRICLLHLQFLLFSSSLGEAEFYSPPLWLTSFATWSKSLNFSNLLFATSWSVNFFSALRFCCDFSFLEFLFIWQIYSFTRYFLSTYYMPADSMPALGQTTLFRPSGSSYFWGGTGRFLKLLQNYSWDQCCGGVYSRDPSHVNMWVCVPGKWLVTHSNLAELQFSLPFNVLNIPQVLFISSLADFGNFLTGFPFCSQLLQIHTVARLPT